MCGIYNMENISSHQETKELKGSNALDQLCKECNSLGNKVLIVFSENMIKQSGLYARVVSLLNICGVDNVTYECVGLHSASDEKKNVITLGKKENVEMILAIGDEVLLDLTKNVAHGFHDDDLIVDGQKKHLPIINIAALLKDSEKGKKNLSNTEGIYKQIKPAVHFFDYDF